MDLAARARVDTGVPLAPVERPWRFVRKQSLDSIYYEDFARFTAAIDQCLDDLSTVHKGEMETLMTHKFQMVENVPLLAA